MKRRRYFSIVCNALKTIALTLGALVLVMYLFLQAVLQTSFRMSPPRLEEIEQNPALQSYITEVVTK